MARLTEKQKRFVDFYIELGNAAEAARRAGYSDKHASRIATELLTKTHVRDAISERLAAKDAARIASQDEVLQFLTAILRGEVTEEAPLLCGEGFQKLVDKGIGAKDRIKAAELLGKRYGMFSDKIQVEGGSITVVIEDDYGDDQSPVE